MALLANLALFLFCFLPLTGLVGVPLDFYRGRFLEPDEAFPIFAWIAFGWPLFLPSILFVPVAHFSLGLARRLRWDPSRGSLRRLALIAFPLGLLGTHLLVWGTVVFSGPLLVSFLVPGVFFGWLAWIPRSRTRALGS